MCRTVEHERQMQARMREELRTAITHHAVAVTNAANAESEICRRRLNELEVAQRAHNEQVVAQANASIQAQASQYAQRTSGEMLAFEQYVMARAQGNQQDNLRQRVYVNASILQRRVWYANTKFRAQLWTSLQHGVFNDARRVSLGIGNSW